MRSTVILLFLQLWGNVEVSSQIACSTPPDVPHAHISEDTKKAEYQGGHVIHFICDPGYTTSGPTIKHVCTSEGWLAVQQETCYQIGCAVPEIANGYVPGDIQEYKEDDVLHYNCNPIYERIETKTSKCTKQGIRAEWIPEPMCELITCKLTLPPLEGTRYEPDNRNVFSPGNTVRVTCGEKYWISNHQDTAAVTTCKADGKWSVEPVCQEVRCRNQRPQHVYNWDVHWGQTITLDETTRYWCSAGYKKPEGVTLARCTRDGWYPDPLCQALTCNRKDVQNAAIIRNDKQTYRENERVDYICKDGYRGDFTLICKENGWIGNPQCSATTGCQSPPPLTDGDIKDAMKSEYSHDERVEYLCQTYHTMEGQPYRTCNNGEWTGQIRCLKPCVVDREVMNTNNIGFLYSNEDKLYLPHNDWISFGCTGRRGSVGTLGMRQQCVDGVIQLPTCQ